jgi:uncharacterized iron-regulated membrane protein
MVTADDARTDKVSAGEAPARNRGARTKASRVWWAVHQWVGLKLSIFMSFILLTGTLAVFSNEMDWALRPALRVDAATVQGETNWAAMAQSVAAAVPDGRILSLSAPVDRGFAASAIVAHADESLGFVYAHPGTGAFQGHGHWVGAQRILRNMHRHLNLPTKIGVPLVSALSILLLISIVTSFVVYKKWWRGFFRPVRWSDPRTAWGDVHRLMGVWGLWFVALMSATGLWYLAESTGARASAFPKTEIAAVPLDTAGLAARLGPSLAAAKIAYPDLRIERVVFPTKKSGAFQFHGQYRAILVRERANAVWVDAETAEVKLITDARDLNVHQRISEMADPLHFGTFGGVWTKLIWFAFGLALTGLSVSGVAIYATRIAKAERKPARWRRGMAEAWRGMGAWRWPAVLAVVIGFALLPVLFQVGAGE